MENGKTIFTINLDFGAEPRTMSASLSHVGKLSIDGLQSVADLLDDVIKVGRDYVGTLDDRTATKTALPAADRNEPAPIQGKK